LRGKKAKQYADKWKDLIVTTLEDAKAQDIAVLDLEGKSCIADYMIIASGTSQRHVHTLADRISDKLKQAERYYITPEGIENCEWVVGDAGDIVVHIFRPDAREMYNLEKMCSSVMPAGSELEVVSC